MSKLEPAERSEISVRKQLLRGLAVAAAKV
jgi:hypothetical protein